MESPFTELPEVATDNNVRNRQMNVGFEVKGPFVDNEADAYESTYESEDFASKYDTEEWEDEDMEGEEESVAEMEDEFADPVFSREDPLPIPATKPFDFAREPAPGSFWPVITKNKKGREVAFVDKKGKKVGNSARQFLARRTDGNRYHCAVDIYANHKDPVVACEDGIIVLFRPFYRSTYKLLVEHNDLVINYGEVHKDSLSANKLKVGDRVKAGQVIGLVGKMHRSSMLHFETYKKGTRDSERFYIGKTPPPNLLNPTRYLLALQSRGLSAAATAGMQGALQGAVEMGANEASSIAIDNWTNMQAWPGQKLAAALGSGALAGSITGASKYAKITSQLKLYHEIIERISKKYNVNPNITRGIIAAESGGNKNAGINKSGYKGLMQAGTDPKHLDPEISIEAGVKKFHEFRDRYLSPPLKRMGIKVDQLGEEEFLRMVLASYNAGQVTVLKAIEYAKAEGDWRNWFSATHYKRALLYSGGYAKYKSCKQGYGKVDIDNALRESASYKFKKGKPTLTQQDPPLWDHAVKVLSPLLKCWVETKQKESPNYLDKIVRHYKHFEANPITNETYEEELDQEDNYFYKSEEFNEEENTNEEMQYEEEATEETEVESEEENMEEEELEELMFEDFEDEEESEVEDETVNEEEEFSLEQFSGESVQEEEEEYEEEVDLEEWHEDSLISNRDEWEVVALENEPGVEAEAPVSTDEFSKWHAGVETLIMRFAAEPRHNLDQLPIPHWVKPDAFYKEFISKHGEEAKTIIGDASQKVLARYFVLHDTAVAADFTKKKIEGKGVHLWLNAKSPVVSGLDWHVPGLAVKLEKRRNTSFVHIEITRDKDLQTAVRAKTKRKKIAADVIMKAGGVRSYGTYYTDKQYELLAYAYIVASLRKGAFLTVTIHREVDRGVALQKKGGLWGYGHDDPQFFDLNYFYGLVCSLLRIPGTYTFGIQNERALAMKQGNYPGLVNSFVPFVSGDTGAADQYGELKKLNPATTKYKTIKLKYGHYYLANGITNKFKESEIEGEIESEGITDAVIKGAVSGLTAGVIPKLLDEDTVFPGYTCYVNIDIGKNNFPLTMTGIYIPTSFNPTEPTDVIVFLHGMTGTFPGEKARINDLWSVAKLPKYDLRIREDVNASGRNVILVAPSLGKNPNILNNISKKGGFDDYMQKVLSAINHHIVQKRFKGTLLNFKNIILACHSAGGRPMRFIVNADNPICGGRISECWGFDCMYGQKVHESWTSWARKNPAKRLMVYYQWSTSQNSKLLEASTKKLSNVFVMKSPAKNHYWVVREHLKDRILKIGSTTLTKINFEEEGFEGEDFLTEMDDLVKDLSKATRLNREYAIKLGWGVYIFQINDLLLPFSGMSGVSLGEEAFAQSLAAWQKKQGFSAKDSDGILGPGTWRRMKPLLSLPAPPPAPSTGGGVEATEWNSNPNIRAKYSDWQAYKVKRDQVVSWGVGNPVAYIEAAIQEWNANPGIHRHFGNNFDGVPNRSYLNLKRLYNARGIANPAQFFTNNLVNITFFTRSTPGHRDLQLALNNAQTALIGAGHNFVLDAGTWSFVPRTFNNNINRLSNHALGRAIDINPGNNPHILDRQEVQVINAVCGGVLTNGLLSESDPDVLRTASQHFQRTFNDAWVGQQTQAGLLTAIRNRRAALNGYAATGFMNLPSALVRGLQAAGLGWGGAWTSAKDFMHFELAGA